MKAIVRVSGIGERAQRVRTDTQEYRWLGGGRRLELYQRKNSEDHPKSCFGKPALLSHDWLLK